VIVAWETPHHLPSRPGTQRPPRQQRGTTPQNVGRYPRFDVLSPEVVCEWDEPTRRVVLDRLHQSQGFRYFSEAELPCLRAFCDVLLAQSREPRVPVPEMLDAKYADGKLDGFRYASMPHDGEAWHAALKGLDFTARARYGRTFAEADEEGRKAIIRDLQQGNLQGGPWDRLDRGRIFSVLTRGVVSEFYSHPWAWNEIGFGGPAYPRGFMRFGDLSTQEPFESSDAVGADPVREAESEGLP
jgi:hypothetical protein